jgi:hypothetical protein
LLPPNSWKYPFWLAQVNSGGLSIRIHRKGMDKKAFMKNKKIFFIWER